ncbi:MAG: hypothetical protein AVDCRST_MAG68-3826 [uncultured Gemmatimonadetes bacterium]|uniref:Uncharacterized protein n=1 Tax=uncultured Gemmatimonadota bacterium TaxID=203437 RepID=A0A6J4M981_9BACT|nr:MAG: hypothetical protein AVDCRST_MAG68-3826 [uncultured Gemmatimonadota bacterium]
MQLATSMFALRIHPAPLPVVRSPALALLGRGGPTYFAGFGPEIRLRS